MIYFWLQLHFRNVFEGMLSEVKLSFAVCEVKLNFAMFAMFFLF